MNNSYVYALVDPNNDSIFYVGKGTGYRDVSHFKPSMWSNPEKTNNPFLYFKIKSLFEKDTPPQTIRLLENVSEDVAYEYESDIIKKMGRRFVDGGELFNISDFKGGSHIGQNKPWTKERHEKHKQKCKQTRIYDPSFQKLFQEYVEENLTRKQIAEKYNISEVLVKKRLQELKIKKPKQKCYPNKNTFRCIRCDKIFFTPKSLKNRKYCSKTCYRSDDEFS
jgi:hypothetical protein